MCSNDGNCHYSKIIAYTFRKYALYARAASVGCCEQLEFHEEAPSGLISRPTLWYANTELSTHSYNRNLLFCTDTLEFYPS